MLTAAGEHIGQAAVVAVHIGRIGQPEHQPQLLRVTATVVGDRAKPGGGDDRVGLVVVRAAPGSGGGAAEGGEEGADQRVEDQLGVVPPEERRLLQRALRRQIATRTAGVTGS